MPPVLPIPPGPPGPLGPDLLDESLLRRALSPRRPDPGEFRAGIEERLAQAAREAAEEGARLQAAPERLRWAAAFLPPGLVPGAAGAAGAAGLAGKKLGVKALPGLFAIPAVTLAMILAGFFFALWGLFRKQEVSAPFEEAREVTTAWWRRNKRPALVWMFVLLALVVTRHPEALAFLLLASMTVGMLLVAQLGRAGLADGRSVGTLLGRMLWFLALYWIMLRDFLPADPGGSHPALGMVLLLAGALSCYVVAGQWTWAKVRAWLWTPVRMAHPDPLTSWCLRILTWPFVTVTVATGLAVLFFGLASALPVTASRAALVSWVEDFDPLESPKRSDRWMALARTVRELANDEDPAPESGGLLARLETAAPLLVKERGAWLARLRLGQLSDDELERLCDNSAGRALRDEEGELRLLISQLDLEVEALLRQGLDEERRARLGQRLLTRWPEPGDPHELRALLHLVVALEELGVPHLLQDQRERAHAVLAACWIGAHDRRSPRAGFAAGSELAEIHGSHSFLSSRVPSDDPADTQAAVELIRRFGAPDSIDLVRVRRALEAAARGFPVSLGRSEAEVAFARLGLYQLDRMQAAEGIDWLRALIDRRVPLAALLLSALCVVATQRARGRQA